MSSPTETRYWNPYFGGVMLGLLLFVMFLATGHGIGASGGVNRIIVAVEDVIAPIHVNNTEYLAKMAGADTDPLNSWLVWAVLGTLIGGFVSGRLRNRVKVETHKGPNISVKTRWMLAMLGGLLMGYGARLARGCTSGQGLSGGSVGSVGSWAFLMAIFAAAFGLAWFFRKAWR